MTDNKGLGFVLIFTAGVFLVLTVLFVIWIVKQVVILWRNWNVRDMEARW